jgi:hypothetical protein
MHLRYAGNTKRPRILLYKIKSHQIGSVHFILNTPNLGPFLWHITNRLYLGLKLSFDFLKVDTFKWPNTSFFIEIASHRLLSYIIRIKPIKLDYFPTNTIISTPYPVYSLHDIFSPTQISVHVTLYTTSFVI